MDDNTVRPSLMEVAEALEKLKQAEMNDLVSRRLLGTQPQAPLPSLEFERGEDLADILIDSYWLLKKSGRDLNKLKIAAEIFIRQVAEWNDELIKTRLNAVMEIIWLCSRLNIRKTAHIMAYLGTRGVALKLNLSNNEPLSNFALRAISYCGSFTKEYYS